MKGLIPYLALCLFVHGCVGAAVLKTRTTPIQDPVIPDNKEYWPRPREAFDMINTVVYSAAWLERRIG